MNLLQLKARALICFVLLLLTACTNQKTFHFHGESENWDVRYVVDIVGENSESSSIVIRYFGEASVPEKIYYYIDHGSGASSGNVSLDEGVLRTSGGSCSGCAVTKENEEIDVIIEWNGETENFTLNNK